MSVRVNLLPREVKERGRESRVRILAGVLGLLLIVVLAGLSLLQRGNISDARDQLAAVEETNAALRADITALQPFADLEARASAAVEVVASALSDEISVATILQDLSAVLPPNAELETVALVTPGEAQQPSPGGSRPIFGRLEASGRVLDGVAPGVERLVIDIERVAAFDNVYMTTSTVDEDGVATFTLEIEFGPEVLSSRYLLTDAEVTP